MAEPVFAEPWEAEVFALATALGDRGLFTPAEWADALGAAIGGAPDLPYFQCWLAALEHVVIAKGATDAETLSAVKDAWDQAARRTPHGRPIALPGSDRSV